MNCDVYVTFYIIYEIYEFYIFYNILSKLLYVSNNYLAHFKHGLAQSYMSI